MELKPGYKMTEAGVIPEDWTETKISSIAKIIGGGTPSTAITSYWNGEIPWFTPAEINDKNKYISTSNRTISHEGLKNSSAKLLPHGTILFTTRASIGLKAILLKPATTNQGFQNLIINSEVDNQFIYYLLEILKKEIIKQASGSTFLEISPRKLGEIRLYLPRRIQEQQAIAAALSDVDELLGSLDRLIAKKKDIRLATMQELLTGKKRLSGFQVSPAFQITEAGTIIPDDWQFMFFGDIVTKIVGGGTPKRDTSEFWGGDIPWATVKDFATFSFDKTQEYITQKGVSASATHIIPAGTLIIATRMALGKTAIYKVNVAINQDLKAVIFNQDIDTNFIRYWFQWQEKNIQSLGSGSTVLGISTDLLKKISIAMPSLAEQQAIASVLSDMDAEIEALETRRDKVRHIKAGMMQELLTGKTRLISSGERA